jgi:hypothetical protein
LAGQRASQQPTEACGRAHATHFCRPARARQSRARSRLCRSVDTRQGSLEQLCVPGERSARGRRARRGGRRRRSPTPRPTTAHSWRAATRPARPAGTAACPGSRPRPHHHTAGTHADHPSPSAPPARPPRRSGRAVRQVRALARALCERKGWGEQGPRSAKVPGGGARPCVGGSGDDGDDDGGGVRREAAATSLLGTGGVDASSAPTSTLTSAGAATMSGSVVGPASAVAADALFLL